MYWSINSINKRLLSTTIYARRLLFVNAENGARNPRLGSIGGRRRRVFAGGARAGCSFCRRLFLVTGQRLPFLLQRRKFFNFIFGRWLLGGQTWVLWLRTAVLRLRTGSNAAVLHVRERTLSFGSCWALQNRSRRFRGCHRRGRRRRRSLSHLTLQHNKSFLTFIELYHRNSIPQLNQWRNWCKIQLTFSCYSLWMNDIVNTLPCRVSREGCCRREVTPAAWGNCVALPWDRVSSCGKGRGSLWGRNVSAGSSPSPLNYPATNPNCPCCQNVHNYDYANSKLIQQSHWFTWQVRWWRHRSGQGLPEDFPRCSDRIPILRSTVA